MAYKDGETFTTYCDKDYDRHTYTLVFKNGRKLDFIDYYECTRHWYTYKNNVSHIQINDKKQSGKGF